MTITRTARVLAGAAALTIAMTGFASLAPANAAAPAKKSITLEVSKLPAQVRLVPGESVKLVLSTNLTTGYSWSTKTVGHKASVAVSPGVYVAPEPNGMVGVPGTTTWIITAKEAGTAVVKVLTTPPGSTTASVDGSMTVIVQKKK